jgi:hypothetical protein
MPSKPFSSEAANGIAGISHNILSMSFAVILVSFQLSAVTSYEPRATSS